ncbi:MAG: hypothetical protein J07HX5_00658 [halophilic archaeon J07HX5]|nr:MAG: hypothetical protein J07HX5_00658 [halophilic archaeon J07HX5]
MFAVWEFVVFPFPARCSKRRCCSWVVLSMPPVLPIAFAFRLRGRSLSDLGWWFWIWCVCRRVCGLSLLSVQSHDKRRRISGPQFGGESHPVVVLTSFVYGILVRESFLAPMSLWIGIAETGALVLVVYAFYRLGMTFETITHNPESSQLRHPEIVFPIPGLTCSSADTIRERQSRQSGKQL